MDPAEIAHWETTNDPIDRYVKTLQDSRWATADELRAVDAEIDAELDAAVAEAETSPLPEADEARTDVTGDGPVNAPWFRHTPPDPSKA